MSQVLICSGAPKLDLYASTARNGVAAGAECSNRVTLRDLAAMLELLEGGGVEGEVSSQDICPQVVHPDILEHGLETFSWG